MSALLVLSEYGSDSGESDTEPTKKRLKLPPPNLSNITVVPKEEHLDDPALHGGRTRSFPHVRGNWATFVYIQYPKIEGINCITEKITNFLATNLNESCSICADFHISLSKTFVLKFHLIESFTKSLQTAVQKLQSFEVNFDTVKIYCNEELTRTFIAVEVDYFSQKCLLKCTDQIDKILKEYNLPTFYEEPSFHMSVVWVNGDKRSQLQEQKTYLSNIVSQEINKGLRTITIDKISCKSGNKYFQYFLE